MKRNLNVLLADAYGEFSHFSGAELNHATKNIPQMLKDLVSHNKWIL